MARRTHRIGLTGVAGIVAAAAVASVLMAPLDARAGEVRIAGAGGVFSVPVTSIKEAKFKTIIRQHYDFSCGAAAVATLLSYHYGQPTDEEQVFKAMFESGDQETIRKKGFSLLDMKRYLASKGYAADGFRIPIDKLAKARVPAIVVINTTGYKHFVVVKGISDTEVLVGDPAAGLKVYTRDKFEEVLDSDIVFAIRDKRDQGRETFSRDGNWAVKAKAPIGSTLNRQGIASMPMLLPTGNGEF